MKILHIHTKMVSGGIEAIVCGLVNEMSMSNDVTLCTIFQPNKEDVFYKKIADRVKKVTIGKKHFGFSLKEIFKIYNIIRKGKYDIVHVHGCFQYYFLAMLLLHNKTRFFYTIHSNAKMENQTWDWRFFKLKRYFFAKRYVIPVTISETSQASFKELYQCDSELVYNGTSRPVIDMTNKLILQYRFTPQTKVFIHAGRVCKAKNQIVLCKVFKRLINEGHDVVLLIAGSPEDKIIFKEVETYFSDRIVYMGEQSDIPTLLFQCDAFCLPSIWEGLPVTLLEAFATSCVPICSPVGGIPNVVEDGINGLLSNDSSEDEYYKTICRFLMYDNIMYNEIKKKSYNSFVKYDIASCSAKYIEIYKMARN